MSPSAELTSSDLDQLRADFDAVPQNRLFQNAVTRTPITGVALDHQIATSIDRSMSHRLDKWEVTNQKKSGRCWMFAGLNLLRVGAMEKLGMKKFEFSQNHTLFWDKLERANFFVQSMVDLADRDADDRTLAWVLQDVTSDGGQWNMFAALVTKHGLVPQSVMPETESSSNTGAMNSHLRSLLRQAARDLREAGDAEQIAQIRATTMQAAYRLLAIHLGTPPTEFDWQWIDDEGTFHRDGILTPTQFRDTYLTVDVNDYVCLVDDPRPGSPRGRTFTVDQLGNIIGGAPVRYLDVDADTLRRLAAEAIKDGEPVWFGCDVGQQMDGEVGIWDAQLFDTDAIYGTQYSLDKAARLAYHETLMTHAMLLTGVDLDADGAPRRWRVENSWGDEKADKGFYTMNDNWFGEYVFEIAARKDRLPADLLAALDTEPIVLPAWDPMGSLA